MLTQSLVAVGFAFLAGAETLDRIAVTVGPNVISESQLILDLRVAAFLEKKPVDLSGAAKRQAAARLVDQLLILQEAADSHLTLPATEAAVGLVAPYAVESDYQANLARYGISESDLAAHLLAGLRSLTFTDSRFRLESQVSPEDVRNYYDKLAGQAAAQGPIASFEDSRDQIEKLLLEQRVMDTLDKWLEMARREAGIRYREKVFE